MKTFGEFFNKIIKNKKIWDYYDDTYFSDVEYKEILSNSKDFIESILKSGKKIDAFTRKQFELLENSFRLEHTVSLYFMGIMIYDNVDLIKNTVDKYIKKSEFDNITSERTKYTHDTPFCYYWFLICFYHDFGYSFETEDNLKALTKLEESLYEEVKYKLPTGSYRTGVPKVISDNIKSYVEYRYKKERKLDHGAVAGLLFWEHMKMKYYSLRKKYNCDVFLDGDRLWSKNNLFNIHLPVAWTISSHNVWFIKENDSNANKYKEFGLERLIINKPKINLDKHPLLFLLSIVDTIDPVKLFNKCKLGEFKVEDLEKIYFKFKNNSIKYKIIFSQTDDYRDYLQSFEGLNTWLKCRAYYNNIDKIFEIEL